MHAELRASPGVILGAFSIILQEHDVTLLWVENGKVLQYFYQNCKCFLKKEKMRELATPLLNGQNDKSRDQRSGILQ